ncbi:MAG: OmpA family protein [Prevotella sp.]|jgi:outer membrane protein OmpA-like peptidoglycan-associated protein|nr:OmpA family protein [Prevotella sp.]
MNIRLLLSFLLLGLFIIPVKAQIVASPTTTPKDSTVQLINDDRITLLRSDSPGRAIVLSNSETNRRQEFGCPDVVPVLCCAPPEAPPIEPVINRMEKTPVIAPIVRKPFFLPDPVFFRINKYDIDPPEWYKIELAVTFLNENPGSTVVVTGYADKKTGNAKINLKLSEQRSNAVAKAMQTKYGIAKNRISVNWRGDGLQPFRLENDKNRAVLFLINP